MTGCTAWGESVTRYCEHIRSQHGGPPDKLTR